MLSKFRVEKSRKDGYAYWCKACQRTYRDKYHAQHKDELAKKKVEYYRKNKVRLSAERRKEYQIPEVKARAKKLAFIWRQNNKDRVKRNLRSYHLLRTYGITLKQYNEILELQNGVCAICKQSETAADNNKTRPLCVDHDHETNAIRGLLCMKCNVAISFMGDNSDILSSAMSYLHKNNQKALRVG